MSEFWLKALEAAEHAEEEARRLRQRYGPEAEAKVEEVLHAGRANRRRESLEDVRRALRWL
jgi:hypothetical protein